MVSPYLGIDRLGRIETFFIEVMSRFTSDISFPTNASCFSRFSVLDETSRNRLSGLCNRRLFFVHFRRNKSDPDRRFNFDPPAPAVESQSFRAWWTGA